MATNINLSRFFSGAPALGPTSATPQAPSGPGGFEFPEPRDSGLSTLLRAGASDKTRRRVDKIEDIARLITGPSEFDLQNDRLRQKNQLEISREARKEQRDIRREGRKLDFAIELEKRERELGLSLAERIDLGLEMQKQLKRAGTNREGVWTDSGLRQEYDFIRTRNTSLILGIDPPELKPVTKSSRDRVRNPKTPKAKAPAEESGKFADRIFKEHPEAIKKLRNDPVERGKEYDKNRPTLDDEQVRVLIQEEFVQGIVSEKDLK